MQIILDLTTEQAERLRNHIVWDKELSEMAIAAIADAQDRERTSAPRIAKKYTLNCEPGVIFSEGSKL